MINVFNNNYQNDKCGVYNDNGYFVFGDRRCRVYNDLIEDDNDNNNQNDKHFVFNNDY
jgi:hypothetical protein